MPKLFFQFRSAIISKDRMHRPFLATRLGVLTISETPVQLYPKWYGYYGKGESLQKLLVHAKSGIMCKDRIYQPFLAMKFGTLIFQKPQSK